MSKYSDATLMQFARDNMLARIVAQPDACRYCQDLHGHIYRPSEAPEIPIRGCTNLTCRCRYEPIEADTPPEKLLLYQGVDAAKLDRKEEARKLLTQAIELNEANEQAWLWLSGCVDELAEQVRCLEKVLALNPDNELALKGLERLWKLVEEAKPPPSEAAEEELESQAPTESEEELPPQEEEKGVERIEEETPTEPEEELPPEEEEEQELFPPEPRVESRLLSRLRSIPLTPAALERTRPENLVMPQVELSAPLAPEREEEEPQPVTEEEAEPSPIHRDETIEMPALERPEAERREPSEEEIEEGVDQKAEPPPIHGDETIEMSTLEIPEAQTLMMPSEDASEREEADEAEAPPLRAVIEEEGPPVEPEEEYPPLPSAEVETLLLPRLEGPEAPAIPEPEVEEAPVAKSPPGIPKVIACPQCGATNLITRRHCTECGLDLLPGISVVERVVQVGCGCFFCFLAYLIAIFTQTGALTSLEVNLEACAVSVFVFVVAAFIAASKMEGHPPWQEMPAADRHRRRAERDSDTNPAQAIADYSQALHLAPEDGTLYRARAELYEKIGYRQEALEDYKIYLSWAASGGKGKEADFAAAQIARLREEMGHRA